MSFLSLFNAFAMRGCLTIAITEMVVKPQVEKPSIDVVMNSACAYAKDLPVTYNLSASSNKNPTKELHDWDEYTQVKQSKTNLHTKNQHSKCRQDCKCRILQNIRSHQYGKMTK